jgi:2,3-bisphosphoglycerate-independent phosphoglycerate mutase
LKIKNFKLKILFLVIDGLPDDPIPALGNQTPLEAARRTNLDYFARNGLLGFFQPRFLGKLPDSEEVHLALFGYDPKKNLPGRGVLEAVGIGEKILPGDVVLRGNLATIDQNGIVVDRRAGRISTKRAEETIRPLSGLIVKGIKFFVKPVDGHRLAIILRGKGLSEKISDTDDKGLVGKKPRSCRPLAKTKSAKFTADVLNQFLARARTVLASAGSFILTRSTGRLQKVISFEKKWGLKAGAVSKGALYRGIAKYLGMTLLQENGGDPVSSVFIRNKFRAAKAALKKYDFIFCHVKGADLLAEDGDYLAKKRFIEIIDKELAVFKNLKGARLVITSDHATSSLKKSHAKGIIPLLIYPANGRSQSQQFTEKGCQKGNLGEVKNLKIIKLVKKLARS